MKLMMLPLKPFSPGCWPYANKGAALLVMLLIVLAAFSTIIVSTLSSTNLGTQRQKKTLEAITQAKEALLAYASTHDRPGVLPCPDTNNDGSSDPNGNNCYNPIGRLPWKQLNISDLRDGNGERLWYAVSSDFINVPSTRVVNNEDSAGLINICGSTGCGDSSPIPSPSTTAPFPTSNIAAIVFSPGVPIGGNNRQDGTDPEPDPAINIDPAKKALNYLDSVVIDSKAFDNSSGSTNGNDFVAATTSSTFNDKLLPIFAAEIFANVNKRMEKKTMLVELANCIAEYGNNNSTSSDHRLPWSAPLMIDVSDATKFDDSTGLRSGRLPYYVSDSTTALPVHNWSTTAIQLAKRKTLGACSSFPKWWTSWKSYVFYAVGSNFSPDHPPPNDCSDQTGCLGVNGGARKFAAVVIFSGKKLTSQARTSTAERKDASNYLEGDNLLSITNAASNYANSTASTTFNDVIVCINPDMSLSPDCN